MAKPLDERLKAAAEKAEKAANRHRQLLATKRRQDQERRFRAERELMAAIVQQARETPAFLQVLVDIADARIKDPALVKGMLAELQPGQAPVEPTL